MTSGTGTCTVKYDQAGDTNYNAAPQVTETVSIAQGDQTITANTHAPASASTHQLHSRATARLRIAGDLLSSGGCTTTAPPSR